MPNCSGALFLFCDDTIAGCTLDEEPDGCASPTVLAVDTTTAVTLDLSTSGNGTPFLFASRTMGSSSPLWGLDVVEVAGLATPLLIDVDMLGRLYLGTVRLDVDPFSQFSKNLSSLRVEVKCLMHIRNANGAVRVLAPLS